MKNKFLRLLPVAAFALIGTTAANAEAFNGGFVGASLGFDHYNIEANDFIFEDDHADGFSGNGAVVGVYAGYDIAFGNHAFAGVEALADISGAKLSYDDGDGYIASVKAKESYGLTARFGAIINDNTGLYVRAGWINTKFVQSDNEDYSYGTTKSGVLYGLGAETLIGKNAGLRLEYSIVDYGDLDTDGAISAKNGQFKLGASFRF